MALVDVSKGNFTAGELSPRMASRSDVDRFKNGASELENWVVLPQGGLTRRDGLRWVADAKFPNRLTLLKDFEPSTVDAYVLEVGHQYFRFFKDGARVEVTGTPVEVASPFLESDLRLLRTAQSNDVMFLVHMHHAPSRLNRLSNTAWTLTTIPFDPPPTFEAGDLPPVDLGLTALTGAITVGVTAPFFLPADVNRVVRAGTGRAVITSFTNSTTVLATVIDAMPSTSVAAGAWTLRGSPVASLVPTVAGPVGALTSLSLTGGGTNLLLDGTLDDPGAWTDISTGGCHAVVSGGQGALVFPPTSASPAVAILQTVVTPLVVGQVYTLTFDVLAVGDSREPVAVQIGTASGLENVYARSYYSLGFGLKVEFTAPATTLFIAFVGTSFVGTSAIDNVSLFPTTVAGWRSSDVGKYIYAGAGIVQLTAFTSAQLMTGRIIRPFASRDPVIAGAWTLESPAWSDALGWPSAVVLYEGRLFFAGSPQFPQTIWGSAIDDLFNFGLGTTAADAIQFSLVDSGGNITLNQLRWLMPAENMLVGTTHGEYRLIGSGDDPLSAVTPFKNRIQSTFGSDVVQPLKVGAAILFAQRQGSKVREMAFDERTATTFVARDITVTSEHLLERYRVVEMAYQPEPLSVVWCVRSDGVVLGLTYDQSEQIVAWWRFVSPNAEIRSVATIPSPTANRHQVWMAVARNIAGVMRTTIEYLDPESRMVLPNPVLMKNELTGEVETITGWTGLTLDCATVFAGINTTTLTGLSHLEGALVTVVGDGAVFPEQLVVNGQVVLPQAVHTAWVGLLFASRGRAMPVDVPVRGMTSQGLKKRWTNLRLRLQNTACLVVQGERIPFRQPHMPMNQGVAPFTGDRDPPPALGWDKMGMVSFQCDQPLPCTILGIMGTLDQEVRA